MVVKVPLDLTLRQEKNENVRVAINFAVYFQCHLVPSLSCLLSRVKKSKRVKEHKQSAANTGLIQLNLEKLYLLIAT